MKRRLYGTAHDFIPHLGLLTFDPRRDPLYVLAEHDLTDLKDTPYWSDLKRIAEAHGLKYVEGVAVYSRNERKQRINIVVTDGQKSVEGHLVKSKITISTAARRERIPPHPDCGPPGWIQGPSDVENRVALITKLSVYPRIAEMLNDLPVDVYGAGMPGRTSLALLQKYDRVLYLDDLDPCGIKRYLEWKKLICPVSGGPRKLVP